jgi:hypothetical protein
VVFYACKEEDVITTPDLTSTQAAQDHLTAENIFNDVGNIVEIGLKANGQSKSFPIYTLMNSDTSNIDTLIIDFGTANVLDYGELRRGKIIVTYTGKYRDYLSEITTTFDNYHVNNNLVQGERIVENEGRDSAENICFKIEVNNASINTTNGTINWNSNRKRVWVNGSETYTINDDKYKITGSASGNGANGNSFTMDITDTLNVDLGCLPSCIITSGTAKVSPNSYSDRIINYGDSICDCNFDVIINGITYPIVVGN